MNVKLTTVHLAYRCHHCTALHRLLRVRLPSNFYGHALTHSFYTNFANGAQQSLRQILNVQ